MRSLDSLLAGLLGAVLAAAALVATPASASMLGVDGGSLHHWVEHGPDLSEAPGEQPGTCHSRPDLPPQATQPCPPPCEGRVGRPRPPMCGPAEEGSPPPSSESGPREAKPPGAAPGDSDNAPVPGGDTAEKPAAPAGPGSPAPADQQPHPPADELPTDGAPTDPVS